MARVAITGVGGQLGRALVPAFQASGHRVRGFTHAEFDIARAADAAVLRDWRPEVVVNAAAWTDVDGCARDPARAMAVNGEAAGTIAELAAGMGATIVQISTNEVFDGELDRPYRPDDEPNPISAYGRSKLAGERAVAQANPRHLIVRTAWLFGPGGSNFVTKILAAAGRARGAGQPLRLVEDEVGNPTWAPDLASTIATLVARPKLPAIVHLVGTPPSSRLDWGRVVLDAARIDVAVEAVGRSAFERASTPPGRAVLEPLAGAPAMTWEPRTRAYAAQLAGVAA